MKFQKSVASLAVAAALGGLASTAQAVYLSEDGTGDALIFPYYTVQGTNDTLISVVNTTSRGKAVKVRFLEGKNSIEVLDFNLYLSPWDAWSGVVTRNGDGNAILRTYDVSCTSPQIPASAAVAGARDVAFRNFAYAGLDQGGSGLDRAREGYVELIEMGEISTSYTISGTTTLLAAITHGAGGAAPAGCALVSTAWTPPSGRLATAPGGSLTTPNGGLIGSGAIINVPQGTDYSYEPVVLDTLLQTAVHTSPGSVQPSLAQAAANSTVVVKSGTTQVAINSSFTTGRDAVSSVLMHRSVINEFSTLAALSAGTDLVVTFPTKRFYLALESEYVLGGLVTAPPFYTLWDDTVPVGPLLSNTYLPDGSSSGACEPATVQFTGREEERPVSGSIDFSPVPPGPPGFALCWEVNVLTIKNSNVLNSANVRTNINLPSGIAADGWLQLSFDNLNGVASARRLVSSNNNTFFGLPVVGFAVQRYVNGNVGGVLSNYGGAYSHKYTRQITPAQIPG